MEARQSVDRDPSERPRLGVAVSSLVVALLALVGATGPYTSDFGLPLSIAAILLARVAVKGKYVRLGRAGRGVGIAALIGSLAWIGLRMAPS